MAYYDENGKITIDEYAAQNDIRRIEAAILSLNNAKGSINNLINQASNGQGDTSVAIIEKAVEVCNYIDDMISRLSETISFIKRTVAHYQFVDMQIKNTINATRQDINNGLK